MVQEDNTWRIIVISRKVLNDASATSPGFLYNKTNQMHQFPKFNPAWNSACFGQLLWSRTRMELRGVPSWSCSKAVYKPVWHRHTRLPFLSVQWINSWLWAEELPETCRVSYWSKSGKLVDLMDFIIKKFVTMHGYVNVKIARVT